MTHDYKRNGTTTLFAALTVLTGDVIGACLLGFGVAMHTIGSSWALRCYVACCFRQHRAYACSMTIEVAASPESSTSDIRRVIEILAGLSGVFLLVAYISGRIYLQAYYSAFHTELSDLDLSIQDIMFQARVSLLGPVLSLLLLVVSMPWLQSVALVRRRHQAVAAHAREHEGRVTAMSERITASRLSALERITAWRLSALERIAAGTLSAAELDVEMTAAELDVEMTAAELDVEVTALKSETEAILQELDSVDEALETANAEVPIPRRLEKPLAVLGRIPALAFSAALWTLVVLGTASYVYSHYGRTSALYAAAAITSAISAVIGLQWLGQRLSDQADSRRWIDHAAALLLGAYIVLALPFFTGLSLGRMSKSADVGFATVVLTTDHPLDSSWTANGSDFVSPKLRLLGRNRTFLVVWDPTRPDKSYSVPLATIRGIERGSH